MNKPKSEVKRHLGSYRAKMNYCATHLHQRSQPSKQSGKAKYDYTETDTVLRWTERINDKDQWNIQGDELLSHSNNLMTKETRCDKPNEIPITATMFEQSPDKKTIFENPKDDEASFEETLENESQVTEIMFEQSTAKETISEETKDDEASFEETLENMSSERKTIHFSEVVTVENALNMSRYNENKLGSRNRWKGKECKNCKKSTFAELVMDSFQTNIATKKTHIAVPERK